VTPGLAQVPAREPARRPLGRPPRLVRRIVFAALLVATPALADAPPDQYEQFDRDTTIIKDLFTFLEWERRPITTTLALPAAKLRCESSIANGRLPTVKELLTIVDEEPHDEYEAGAVVAKMIDALAFPDTPVSQPYWTSTKASGNAIWAVDFKTGTMVTLDATSGMGHARCVR
jgi:hypothetical protein